MAKKINLHELKEKGALGDPFPAPEGYFDDLAQRIQARIDQEEELPDESPGKTIRVPQRWYYAAAAVVLLALSVWMIRPITNASDPVATTTEDPVQALLTEVSDEALIDYLQMNQVDALTTVPLTDAEQEELLESELESYDVPEEYYLDTDYLEEYL